MRNLTAKLFVLAGTVLPTTDGGALDMQEQAICKQTEKTTKKIANIDTLESTYHKEVRCSQILKSEEDTCCVVETINNFINPFTIEDKDTLYCPSSSAPVPSNVENDILMSDEIGKKAYKQFVQDRLTDKTVSFHVPVKKQRITTINKRLFTSTSSERTFH